MFTDRQQELALLERLYASSRAELFVLYGRRRVGKTELLRTFCRDKRHIFFVADLGTEATALAEFTRQVSAFAFDRPEALAPFPSWDAAFEFLLPYAQNERLLVVLDEFTYLIEIDNALPSILQRLWDTKLKDSQIMLVLCGSYVGMMEQHVLGYHAPLYGRRTGQWKLAPLDFWSTQAFFPGFSPEDQVRAYAVLGGVPAYLAQFHQVRDLLEGIREHILTPGAFLFEEPRFLLLQELRDPHRYFAVLEAIAGGRTRRNDIAQLSGIAVQSVGFYLNTLQEIGLIERVVPATARQPHKYKRGLYRLQDHFFRFWFRYVYPNRSALESGHPEPVYREVMDSLDQFTGPVFEEIARAYVPTLHRQGRIPWTPERIGSWWDRRDEIDVAAVNFREKKILLGECKWTTRPIGVDVLAGLRDKASRLRQQGPWQQVDLALFARAGFTPEVQSQAEVEGILLVDLQTLTAEGPP